MVEKMLYWLEHTLSLILARLFHANLKKFSVYLSLTPFSTGPASLSAEIDKMHEFGRVA